MGARRIASSKIFAVIWSDLGVTVATASSREEARRYVRKEDGGRLNRWLMDGDPSFPDLIPVSEFEIGVGPRRNLNAPTFCRMRLPGQRIAWAASGWKVTRRRWTPTPDVAEPSPISPTRIWSYVWQARELVFFVAPDFDSACDRALERAKSWGFSPPPSRRFVAANLEPVDRLGICLRPPSLESAPLRYWAWVEGVQVGWPPIRSEESAGFAPVPPASPGSPVAAYALPPGLRYLH